MRVSGRNNLAVSMNASFNGAAFGLDHLEGFSVQLKWTNATGPITGTFKLQASNNAILDNPTASGENPAAIWEDIDGSSENVSGSGSAFINVADCYYRSFRVVWTHSSGTGSVDIYIWAKGTQS